MFDVTTVWQIPRALQLRGCSRLRRSLFRGAPCGRASLSLRSSLGRFAPSLRCLCRRASRSPLALCDSTVGLATLVRRAPARFARGGPRPACARSALRADTRSKLPSSPSTRDETRAGTVRTARIGWGGRRVESVIRPPGARPQYRAPLGTPPHSLGCSGARSGWPRSRRVRPHSHPRQRR